MTRYRFKVDTPWGKKWADIDSIGSPCEAIFLPANNGFVVCYPEKYPDLFEPIHEEDPVEKVGRWLYETKYPQHGQHLIAGFSKFSEWEEIGPSQEEWKEIAKKLIAAGLDHEKLK